MKIKIFVVFVMNSKDTKLVGLIKTKHYLLFMQILNL